MRPAIAAMPRPLVFLFLLANELRGKASTKDASLYLVVDRGHCRGRGLAATWFLLLTGLPAPLRLSAARCGPCDQSATMSRKFAEWRAAAGAVVHDRTSDAMQMG